MTMSVLIPSLGTAFSGSDAVSPDIELEIYNFIQGYIVPGVLLIGIMGNTLSLVVFIRTRKRTDAAVQYLSTLAISDTAFILFLGVAYWMSYGLSYLTNGANSYNIITYSKASCKIFGFLRHSSEVASAWAIVAFTLERVYIVWYPLKRADITAKKRTVVIIAIWVMSACLSIYRLVLNDVLTKSSISNCFYDTPLATTFWILMYDITAYNYIPCFFIFIANILILVGIRRANTSMESKVVTSRQEHNYNRLVVSLLLVSTCYVVFMTPLSVSGTHYFYYLKTAEVVDAKYHQLLFYVLTFLEQFSLLTYCFNFIIYGCTLPFYRKEVYCMLSLRMRSTGNHKTVAFVDVRQD